jgi:hypothetical protein
MGAIQGPTSTDVNLITQKPDAVAAAPLAATAQARAAPDAAFEPVLPRDEWHGREQFVSKRFDARRALDDIEQRMNWRWGGGPITDKPDNFPPIQAMYGVTIRPDAPDIQPMYGVTVQPPPNDPPIQAMYGATITPPDIQPMYGVTVRPPDPRPDFQPMYGVTVNPQPFDPPPFNPRPFDPFPFPPFNPPKPNPWAQYLLPNPISHFGLWGDAGCGPGHLGGHGHLNHRQRDLASRFDDLWARFILGF